MKQHALSMGTIVLSLMTFLAAAGQLCAAPEGPTGAIRGISLDTTAPRSAEEHSVALQSDGARGILCLWTDFEGYADLQLIGTLIGPPDITFGPAWNAIIDADAGGTGNIANEPSPDTIAFYPTDASPPGLAINFSAGVNSFEVFYSAAANSLPVTLTAWDGPNGTGNAVAAATGNEVGASFDGAPCGGDPNGDYCRFSQIILNSNADNILSITVQGTIPNFIGFDNLVFCLGTPVRGACELLGEDCVHTIEANCNSMGGTYLGDNTSCYPVPTVSEWGLIVMTVLVLTTGTVLIRRRRSPRTT